MTGSGGQSPAEQHLGDRLAALVDGELGHDARERVLAHLATCPRCKAEADEQRRLKNVFAQAAPPPPSEGFLARLQNLPAGPLAGDDDERTPFGAPAVDPNPFDLREGAFAFLPTGAAAPRERGFRIHEVDRTLPRSRRFAFAAAGAVSLAAVALGGALPLDAAVDSPGGRAEGNGTAITPLRTEGGEGATAGLYESARRSMGLFSASGERSAQLDPRTGRPITPPPTATTHPGVPSWADGTPSDSMGSALPPLIQPVLSLAARSSAGQPGGRERNAAPAPTHMDVPSHPASQATPLTGAGVDPRGGNAR
ncbi:anti-sigma factor family protein [Streptomyces sp. NPDC057702]|uniref:anti-sigma factor family protein n=1 Tax=unclassified Streptomyces TaxID=2593676 RepID=UPI00368E5C8F